MLWISIPTSYWTGVSTGKFGSLRYVAGDKKKTGTYEVWISDFVDEYIQVVSQRIEGTTSGSTTAILNGIEESVVCLTTAL